MSLAFLLLKQHWVYLDFGVRLVPNLLTLSVLQGDITDLDDMVQGAQRCPYPFSKDLALFLRVVDWIPGPLGI